MTDTPDETEIAARIYHLTIAHRDLDSAIDALHERPSRDALQIARLKRRKLRIKDEIATLSNLLTPDIIA